jgi:hypothetical protein
MESRTGNPVSHPSQGFGRDEAIDEVALEVASRFVTHHVIRDTQHDGHSPILHSLLAPFQTIVTFVKAGPIFPQV